MRLNTFKKHFGARVKRYREEGGLSQEQLAEKIDVDFSTIGKIETGVNFPSAKTIVNLINFFNIGPAELFNFGKRNITPEKDNEILYKILNQLYECDDKKLEYFYKIITYLVEEEKHNADGEKFDYFYKMIKYLNENK